MKEETLQETVRLIEKQSRRFLAVLCDVTQGDQIKAALNKAIDTFDRLHYAFKNAGGEQPKASLADVDEAEWGYIINANWQPGR